ncbi:cytochrome c oxidase subunit 5A, mitochondrial-like [Tubulanus polymorphus]|uniref:cytochrome c oxidase subunit 5A, mitochondrial-like n=1 Tax=Tubulanus polymorphus TaxID=672921 RepID=UPI003DA23277
MFRLLAQRATSGLQSVTKTTVQRCVAVTSVRHMSKHSVETDEEFDARYEQFFSNPNIDGWDVRRGMNELQGFDLVPEPRIIVAALKACRRINDHSLAVRYLEAVQFKCGNRKKVIWPYILQEITPTLEELGISTPEQLGYDKPELAMPDVLDMH